MYLYSSSGNLTMFPLWAVALNIGLGIWRSVVVVEELCWWRKRENPRKTIGGQWQALSHNAISRVPRHDSMSGIRTLVVICTDYMGSRESNYHAITTYSFIYRLRLYVLPFKWTKFSNNLYRKYNHKYGDKYTLVKTERAIQMDTGNVGCTRHRTKTNNPKNTQRIQLKWGATRAPPKTVNK